MSHDLNRQSMIGGSGDSEGSGLHHPETLLSAAKCSLNWRECIASGKRCGVCWLEKRKCFCTELSNMHNNARSSSTAAATTTTILPLDVELLFYYHYIEVGRSVNTAHIMKVIFPEIYREVVYGNIADEMALFKQIAEENAQYSGCGVCTCVLYPSSTAVSLNEWLSCHTNSNYSAQYQSTNRPDKKLVRLILLDGTYIQANKQYKHLLKCNDAYKLGLTFVKLDFDGEGGCNSAMSKITKQPDEVKICTYQAAIMAIRQVVGDRIKSESYDSWYRYLDTWIAYMLSAKVKQGESKKEKEKGPIESPQKVLKKTDNLHQAAEEDVIRGNLKLAGSNDISEGARDILATINLFRSKQRTAVIKKTNKFAVYELIYDANI